MYIQFPNHQGAFYAQKQSYSTPELYEQTKQYELYRDRFILAMVGIYMANIVDALVDAYLFNFDVSTDLSLKNEPTLVTFNPAGEIAANGLKISLRFQI